VSDGPFAGLAFAGEWRRYQRLALDAFERDRAAGRRGTHLVAPPGSGKTLLGIELVRRIGRRALVLAPTATVQAAWLRSVRMFTPRPQDAPRYAGAHPAAPLACLTYQALCQLEDPEIALGRVAIARWEEEREGAEVASVTAALKQEIARGDHGRVSLADLLSASARARVEHLRAAGVGTVVLDECQHLASPWGYVVRAVLDELGDDVHVIGITATPPGELPAADADVYAALVGPVDYTVPTPAVVRDGRLAPYQELAWLTEPLDAERTRLSDHDDTDGDRLLTGSQAKPLGMVDVLAVEIRARGDGLRAVVLCDAEAAEPGSDGALGGVLDPAAGTARRLLMAIAADPRTAPLRPLLVSGRGLRCVPADAETLVAALAEEARERYQLPEWDAEADGLLCSLRSSGAEWVARAWLDLATRLLEQGVVGVLVGTQALLGEGWECRPLNCLVDLTVESTGVSVQQMRGRSLLLDPGDPAKVASNWDVVCAAPDLVRGSADYARFVRRHRHLYAPADDGAIEAGPAHVHPELSASGPPPAGAFGAINAAIAERAGARAAARERWRIGTPYRGVELRTLLVRLRAGSVSAPSAAPAAAPGLSQRLPLGAGFAGAAGFGAAALAASTPPLLAGVLLAPAGLGWAALRLRAARQRLPLVLPLDRAARAVAGAYEELGELSAAAAASVDFAPRVAGWLRCTLPAATPEESARVVSALAEVLGPTGDAGHLVGRPLAEPGVGAGALLGRVLRRRPPFPERLHPVPADLGRSPERAAAFARAWTRWVGPGRLVAAGSPPAEDSGWETMFRDMWV
jgi:Type III restriction enzyme, res subunit